jgi:hypothetical protein
MGYVVVNLQGIKSLWEFTTEQEVRSHLDENRDYLSEKFIVIYEPEFGPRVFSYYKHTCVVPNSTQRKYHRFKYMEEKEGCEERLIENVQGSRRYRLKNGEVVGKSSWDFFFDPKCDMCGFRLKKYLHVY